MLCAHPWQVLEHPSLCLWRVGRARGARVRHRLKGQQYTHHTFSLLFTTPPPLDSEGPPSGGGA